MNKIIFKNPNDFFLLQKMRSNDSYTISSIFDIHDTIYKDRYIQCMMRATGEEKEPPEEWLLEMKQKMMENDWGESDTLYDEKGNKRKGFWGSLRNFKPDERTFDEWFVGSGKWYEVTSDCVAFRFFLTKAIKSSDDWATDYIFNYYLHSVSKRKFIIDKPISWHPPICFYVGLYEWIIGKIWGVRDIKGNKIPKVELRENWILDLYSYIAGSDKDDENSAWVKLDSFDPTNKLFSWLASVSLNFTNKKYFYKPKKEIFSEWHPQIDIELLFGDNKTDSQIDEKSETWQILVNTINKEIQNSDTKTHTLVLQKLKGIPTKRIAATLDMKENTVDKFWHDWRKRMRKKYLTLYKKIYE